MRILVVDDDRDLVDLLDFVLRRDGFDVLAAHDAASARRLLAEGEPNLVVLDVNLGDENGFDVLRHVRAQSLLPVVMLSARDREDDKVLGLDLGADDYLTKPFSHRELVARIRANLRRHDQTDANAQVGVTSFRVGPLTLNSAEHAVTMKDEPVALTTTEFRVLHQLMANAGSVVTTSALLKQVWGEDDPSHGDVVRVTIHRLRRKLGDDPAKPRLLHTIPGVGIMLKPLAP